MVIVRFPSHMTHRSKSLDVSSFWNAIQGFKRFGIDSFIFSEENYKATSTTGRECYTPETHMHELPEYGNEKHA